MLWLTKTGVAMECKYVLSGDPIPLARARFSHTRRVYDPQKALKLVAQVTLENQHEGPKFEGPLILDVTFFMHIPQYKRKKIKIGDPHYIKPDLDNLLKMVCDYANSILYRDDCIIMECHARKLYDDNPRTEFILKTWES